MPPQAPPPNVSGQIAALERAVCQGANWFYVIGGLSVVNTIINLANGSFAFFFGLGITQFFDGAIKAFGTKAAMIVLPINLIIAGIYAAIGYCSCRRIRWALITGIVLYVLDGLLVLLCRDFLGAAFHGYALYRISMALKADNIARQLEAQAHEYQMRQRMQNYNQPTPPTAPTPPSGPLV